MILEDKNILITGGAGSLGQSLVKRIMTGYLGNPYKIIIFSRDEAKHHQMKLDWKNINSVGDNALYRNFEKTVEFRIGDIRDYRSVLDVVRKSDIIIHASALKQVPSCEYFPFESVKTNILGVQNIVEAVKACNDRTESVVAISTDKACKPINTYGMCKAIQERIISTANLDCAKTRFMCVRYGNVADTTGSVLPLFRQQIKNGNAITITTKEMTRFFLTLDQAVDTIIEVLKNGKQGEIYVPIIPSIKIIDLAEIMIGDKDIKIDFIGIRPGEKIHEILVSEEELNRTIQRGIYYVICSNLPEICKNKDINPILCKEYSSADNLISKIDLEEILRTQGYLVF
jgi:UDP-glucose 4-epimerase